MSELTYEEKMNFPVTTTLTMSEILCVLSGLHLLHVENKSHDNDLEIDRYINNTLEKIRVVVDKIIEENP